MDSTMAPTVAASSRAGRQTDTLVSPFAATRSSRAKSRWWKVGGGADVTAAIVGTVARPSSIQCRSCGHVPPAFTVQYCEECLGPLDVVPGPAEATEAELRRRIEAGPPSMWRYRDLLPFDEPSGAADVGMTPLVAAPSLGAALGVTDLWLKDDTANPSGSFKDRVVAASSPPADCPRAPGWWPASPAAPMTVGPPAPVRGSLRGG